MVSRPHCRALASSSSVAWPTESQGERRACQSSSASHMFPIPATTRWSTRTSPSSRAGSVARSRATRSGTRVASASRSGPSRRASARIELSAPARSTGSPPSAACAGRATGDPPGPLADPCDTPAPVHPEMTAKNDIALEAEQQVLAHRVDRLEHPAVDRLGHVRHEPARVGRRRRDPLADEWAEPRGGSME